MEDLTLAAGTHYERPLAAGRSLAMVIISGAGTLGPAADAIQKQDLAVVHAAEETILSFHTTADAPLRFALIEVPTEVDYPLYPQR